MSLRALAFIVDGKPGISIRLERNDGFDQTVVTNGDGYALFKAVPESPWDVNIHVHAPGYAPYDHVLSSIIPGGVLPAGNHQLFLGQPNHPITPPLDILLPALAPLSLPRINAGRWDFFTEAGERHLVVGSTELMLAWRYDLEGPDAIRPVLAQRQSLRFNNLRVLWQKDIGNTGSSPWLMPLEKLRPFLGLCAEYRFYVEGCNLADCRVCTPGVAEQQQRVTEIRNETVGVSNLWDQLGNEYQKNDFDPRNFSKPPDRMSTNASAVTGGADALPYWDYFTFSGERLPVQKAIREYGPVEFLYGDRGSWGGLPAICGEGFKPGVESSDPRDWERAGAQARSANGGRLHTLCGTSGNSGLFGGLETACAQAFVKGLLG